MTTKHSPLRVLKQQADRVAMMLKQAERGEKITDAKLYDPDGKIAASRARPSVIFGIAMDDKFLKIEMTWALIQATSEVGISVYVLKQMRESRDSVH